MGVGLLEGKNGVNVMLLMKVIGGWIITLVIVGFTSAMFFAQGAYAPSIVNLRTINRFEQGLVDISQRLGEGLGIDSEVNANNTKFLDDKNDDSRRQIRYALDLLADYTEICLPCENLN